MAPARRGSDDCPSDDVLAAHVEGQLDAALENELARHLQSCNDCTDILAAWVFARSVSKEGERAIDALAKSNELLPTTRVGRYSILEPVGAGGMGVVYAALDPVLRRKVALKLLHGDSETAQPFEGGTSRLHREAQAMARASHPNVLAVYDVGLHAGRVFIVMEYVEGTTLRGWLRSSEQSWREIVRVFELAGRGLAGAHEAGLIHADFKPDNVLVRQDGRVFVADFGLTRSVEEVTEAGSPADGRRCTSSGTLKGTPAYMAPEMLETGKADARSDQYSFCLAFAEALSGQRLSPRRALEQWEGLVRGTAARPRLPIPTALAAIVARGLSRAPERRFPSMDALLCDLGPASAEELDDDVRPAPAAAALSTPDPHGAQEIPFEIPPPALPGLEPRRRPAIAGASVMLLALAVLGVAFTSRSVAKAPAPAPALAIAVAPPAASTTSSYRQDSPPPSGSPMPAGSAATTAAVGATTAHLPPVTTPRVRRERRGAPSSPVGLTSSIAPPAADADDRYFEDRR